MIQLPVDPFVPQVVDAARRRRAAVVTAAPGAGKTTRIPPALVVDGPVILLQPRRAAARAIAKRIADEQHWTLGREVGWQVRFERRFGDDTRLLVATEGVLTARLLTDPLLSSFTTIVLDEFHERSIHTDVALALAKHAWYARSDLRIVVMSATLEADTIAAYLDGCPIVRIPGRTYPLEIAYAPAQPMSDAVAEVIRATTGDVLCFLPGAGEIRREMASIEARSGREVDVLPLYGALPPDEQDRVLSPHASSTSAGRRRIIVATNIAETSVTVPGVTAVIDAGLQKVARYDADRGIDSLVVERITQDAADQRAGRAGRTSPGVVRRLWDARDRLRLHREPDIHRIDLSGVALDIFAWGGDPRSLDWFESPQREAIEQAMALLERLGALNQGTLTDLGRRMQRLPLHPRLSRMLIASGGARSVARACALVAERQFVARARGSAASTSCDLLSSLDQWSAMPPHVQRVARDIEEMSARVLGVRGGRAAPPGEAEFRRAILAGYPDRVAQRRAEGSDRVKLSSGAGATIAPDSGVREGDYLVAVDLQGDRHRRGGELARIRVASRVEPDWLVANATEVVHRIDEATGVVRAFDVERYDALILVERATTPDAEVAATLLAEAWRPNEDDERVLRRAHFAGRPLDLATAVRAAAVGARSLADIRLAQSLDPELRRALDRDAPETLVVPSGRAVRLDYLEDGSVRADVKLQELFGLGETPRLGPGREPVLLAVLAPSGRPVQMTRDLKSFWSRTYPEVRKELRARYPKHPWPEDPWTAKPTARATRPGR